MPLELYPHQRQAVNKLASGKILCGGVGTGKSITALTYYFEHHANRDLLVITTAKKRDSGDWEKEAGLLGITNLTVDSWQNIEKYGDKQNVFLVADEQRIVGSGAWVKAFIKIARNNQWVLLSATPGDTWLDYIPVFIANGFYKNRTEFKREHVVYNTFSKFPKVDRYIGVGRLVKLRNSILVEMPYKRHTVRHEHEILVDYDVELFERVVKKRWHVYENRPLRDVAELFSVMRKVVNSDASRLEVVETLLRTHPKLIVFYNFDYELEQLRTLSEKSLASPRTNPAFSLKEPCQTSLLSEPSTQSPSGTRTRGQTQQPADTTSLSLDPSMRESISSASAVGQMSATSRSLMDDSTSGTCCTSSGSTCRSDGSESRFTVAEWNGHKHEEIPKTDRWVYLVQYVAGSEGWNCVETDAICFYSLTYSYKNFEQAHGRIDRLNTPFTDLHYYVLRSDSLIDKAVRRSLLSKKNFNESSFGQKLM